MHHHALYFDPNSRYNTHHSVVVKRKVITCLDRGKVKGWSFSRAALGARRVSLEWEQAHVLTTGLGTAAWEGARGMGWLLDGEEHGSLLLSPDQLRALRALG